MIPEEVSGAANKKAMMYGAGAGLTGALVATVAAFIPFCSCCPFGLGTMALIVAAAFAAAFTADWSQVPKDESMKFGAMLGLRAGAVGGILGMLLSFIGVQCASFLFNLISVALNGGDDLVTVAITYLGAMIFGAMFSAVGYVVYTVFCVILSAVAGVIAAAIKGNKE
jgi:hypothetical protein